MFSERHVVSSPKKREPTKTGRPVAESCISKNDWKLLESSRSITNRDIKNISKTSDFPSVSTCSISKHPRPSSPFKTPAASNRAPASLRSHRKKPRGFGRFLLASSKGWPKSKPSVKLCLGRRTWTALDLPTRSSSRRSRPVASPRETDRAVRRPNEPTRQKGKALCC